MRRLCESFLFAIATGAVEAAPPLTTEDTGTGGKGVARLELTLEQARDIRPDTSYDATTTSSVLYYGVAENVDLQFVVPYLRATGDTASGRTIASGMLDAYVNVIWRFYERDALSFAFVPGLQLPTGDDGLSAERAGLRTLFIASYEPGRLGLHANAGYRHLRNVQGLREDLYTVSASVQYAMHESLRLVADQSGETNPLPGSDGSIRYTTLGAIWIVRPGTGLGCGIKLGHGGSSVDRTYLCGLGVRLN